MKFSPLTILLRYAAWPALAMAALPSHAAITCSLTANGVTTTYAQAAVTTATSSVTVNCSRLVSDSAANVTYYLNLDQGEPPAGRNMTRQNGTELLAYSVFRNSGFTGSWTTGNGQNAGSNTAGGLNVPIAWAGSTNFSVTTPYYFRINAGISRPAGIYDDVATFSLFVTRGGTLLSTATANLNASIVAACFFNSTGDVAINYTSFSAVARTGSANYSMSCTLGTPYTMAVTPTSGNLLGLPYTLALSQPSGVGSAFPQNYSVTATIPSNQSGICATGSCNALQAHQIVITY